MEETIPSQTKPRSHHPWQACCGGGGVLFSNSSNRFHIFAKVFKFGRASKMQMAETANKGDNGLRQRTKATCGHESEETGDDKRKDTLPAKGDGCPASCSSRRRREGLLDGLPAGVFFVTSSALVISGCFGLGYWAVQMRDIWDVEPLLALPQLIAALLITGLGLTGLAVLCNALQPAQRTTEPPVQSRELSRAQRKTAISLEELLAATHEYGAPLPEGVSIRAEFFKPQRLREHIVGQVGPVCAAASVSSALNVLNGLSTNSEDKFRVRSVTSHSPSHHRQSDRCTLNLAGVRRDTMHIYYLIFREKRAEALSKLSKVVKTNDVESAIDLFHDQDICVAARGRNSVLFLKLLAAAAAKLMHNADAGSERHALLAAAAEAASAPDKPSCALVVDRLKRVAKAEWAIGMCYEGLGGREGERARG